MRLRAHESQSPDGDKNHTSDGKLKAQLREFVLKDFKVLGTETHERSLVAAHGSTSDIGTTQAGFAELFRVKSNAQRLEHHHQLLVCECRWVG